MVASNHILQSTSIHMGIDLGGTDVGVTEQLLDHAKVCASDQHVGCEGMTKGMGVHVFKPGDQCIFLDILFRSASKRQRNFCFLSNLRRAERARRINLAAAR